MGKKKKYFLGVNDVHISAISCNYSALEIISFTIQYGLYWLLFLEFTRVRKRSALDSMGNMTLIDNIA